MQGPESVRSGFKSYVTGSSERLEMNGSIEKSKSIKTLQLAFVIFLSLSASVELRASDQDDYYQTCDLCSKQLDSCAKDLETAKDIQPVLKWYQNEWAIIGLSLVAGAVGYDVGKKNGL